MASALNDLIGYNLKRAYMVVQADFRETLGKGGLTARVFSALTLVVEQPGITQSDLARALRIERSGLVAIVDELEEKKLLKRVSVPGNRRVQPLRPTAAGKKVFRSVLQTVRGHEDRLFSVLAPEEQVQLLTLLKKFRQGTEKD